MRIVRRLLLLPDTVDDHIGPDQVLSLLVNQMSEPYESLQQEPVLDTCGEAVLLDDPFDHQSARAVAELVAHAESRASVLGMPGIEFHEWRREAPRQPDAVA